MKELIVITGSTLPPTDPGSGTLQVYLNQLGAAEIDTHVDFLREMPHADGGAPRTLALAIAMFRDHARRFSDYERLVLTDGWDVTFYGTKEDVIRKIPMDRCLIGAAKECYPWGQHLRERTADDTPWMYANGGLIAGTPENILKFADAMATHPMYKDRMENQGMENLMLKEKSEAFHLDNRTELFFVLFNGYDELDFERGLPVNTLCGTRPNFIHANGHWDTTLLHERRKASLR